MPKGPVLQGDPKIVQQGANVVLEAAVEAQPAPDTQWFKDGTKIENGAPYNIKTEALAGDKYKIIAEILNFDKSLSGIYKVNIKNDQGQTAATFTVTAGEAPEFLEKPKIVQREGGKEIAIKMMVQSKKEPRIEWFKDDKPVSDTDRTKLVTKKDDADPTKYTLLLEIKGPIKADQAKYKCLVKNDEGSNSQTLNLAFD